MIYIRSESIVGLQVGAQLELSACIKLFGGLVAVLTMCVKYSHSCTLIVSALLVVNYTLQPEFALEGSNGMYIIIHIIGK